MLRVSPEFILLAPGARKSERTVMGNVAVAEELAGLDELEELYRLDASGTETEDEATDDEGDDEGGKGAGGRRRRAGEKGNPS